MHTRWNIAPTPIIGLSPMADMTDAVFSRLVRELSSPAKHLVLFREMVSAEAIVRGNEKTLRMTDICSNERPVVQQIFGADPHVMAQAAQIIEQKSAPDGIDINMGCPMPKITSTGSGSALMKTPELAAEIVRAVCDAVEIPVSVKMRTGWLSANEGIAFAQTMEEAGAQLLTVHGRTRAQAYTGRSDRMAVAVIKYACSIPVLYNGDITTAQDYLDAQHETQCDGALIGRGALGNPWIFSQIETCLEGRTPIMPTIEQRVHVCLKHLYAHIQHYGPQSTSTFRKHLAWYFKGIPDFKKIKSQIMTTNSTDEIEYLLRAFTTSVTPLDLTLGSK